jgi:hypothetical protein
VTAITDGANGTVTTDGTAVTYTHDGSVTTADSFTYTISDGDGASATATVTITIEQASGGITPLTSGESQLASVASGDWVYYLIEVGSTHTLVEVELSNLSSDVDLYVRNGELPTLTEYGCRPYAGGTSTETCTMVNSGESTWYIGVQGYTAGSFTITAILEEDVGSTITPLTSGENQSASVSSGGWVYYLVEASVTDIEVEVELSNLSSDVDLYVRNGELPTLTEYGCRPYAGGTNTETCTMVNSGESTWYIGVQGYTAGSFTVMATIEAGAGNTPPSADAGDTQTVADNNGDGAEDVTLDGSGSTELL